jgi:hypothetical protein
MSAAQSHLNFTARQPSERGRMERVLCVRIVVPTDQLSTIIRALTGNRRAMPEVQEGVSIQ